MDLAKYISQVQNNEINIVEKTKEVLDKVKALNQEYKFMSVISETLALEQAKELQDNSNLKELPLAGLFVTIKDCVCVKGVETTASSKILKSYEPIFDASVVENLQKSGAIILGKTLQDEFGFGSFSTNTGIGYEVPLNPNDKTRVSGGSSGGSAVATKALIDAEIPHIAIAESTGGSIENPASFCGVIGFCPTYGRVSRYGLLSYANSLDKIGVMADKIKDVENTFNVIASHDSKDSTSVDFKEDNHSKKELKDFKIAIIKDSLNDDVNAEVKSEINKTIDRLKEFGAKVEEINLDFTFKFGIPAYYIIAMSEASTNLSALCGLRYGAQDLKSDEHFSDYFSRIRSESFGEEAKRRIMLGTFTRMAGYRDAFYIKAAKARTKVIEEYKKIFEEYDIIISPTMPFVAPKFDEISKLKAVDHYLADIMTVGPNLAGIPHLSFPIAKDKADMPIGMMISADHFNENKLFNFVEELEKMEENK